MKFDPRRVSASASDTMSACWAFFASAIGSVCTVALGYVASRTCSSGDADAWVCGSSAAAPAVCMLFVMLMVHVILGARGGRTALKVALSIAFVAAVVVWLTTFIMHKKEELRVDREQLEADELYENRRRSAYFEIGLGTVGMVIVAGLVAAFACAFLEALDDIHVHDLSVVRVMQARIRARTQVMPTTDWERKVAPSADTCVICLEECNIRMVHGQCKPYVCDACWEECVAHGKTQCVLCRIRLPHKPTNPAEPVEPAEPAEPAEP